MKINCLCENCGNDQFKSLTSPWSFKYGGTIRISCFECKVCNERYAILPTMVSVIIEQIISAVIPIIIMIMFFKKYPYSTNGDDGLLSFIMLIVSGWALLYGVLITIWNYLKSYIGIKPLSYNFIHIDNEYAEIIYKDERVDFIIDIVEVKKEIKKLREGSVYLYKVGSETGAVKLVKINLLEKRIELLLKKINIDDNVYINSEFILYTSKNKELCRGLIQNVF